MRSARCGCAVVRRTDNMMPSTKHARKESIEIRVALGFLLALAGAIAFGLLGHRTTGRAFASWSTLTRAAWMVTIAATVGGIVTMAVTFRASENPRQFWI